jgi:hypothetical protein
MARKKSKKKKTARTASRRSASRKAATRKRTPQPKRPTRKGGESPGRMAKIHQGVGLSRAGQAGDDQGLSNIEDVDPESVEELADEGQGYEASIIEGVENAPDADAVRRVRTREVPEDDVQPEYRNYRERDD